MQSAIASTCKSRVLWEHPSDDNFSGILFIKIAKTPAKAAATLPGAPPAHDVQAWLGSAQASWRPEKIQARASGLQKPKLAEALGLGHSSHMWYAKSWKTPKSYQKHV